VKLNCKPKELLQKILKLGLSGMFPNITIVLLIFVSLPVSGASGENNFSVLKHTVQVRGKIVWSHHAQYQLTLHES
jgi:hypothetical protein